MRKPYPFTLHVETICGTTTEECAASLIMLAQNLGMFVKTDFNGVAMWASGQCTPGEVLARFYRSREAKWNTEQRRGTE